MPSEQRILLFESQPAGILTSKREDNLSEIQAMLDQGWKVASMSPTSSPAMSAGAELRVFALIVLERDSE